MASIDDIVREGFALADSEPPAPTNGHRPGARQAAGGSNPSGDVPVDPETGTDDLSGWRLDIRRPTLDPDRAEVMADWAAAQVRRHVSSTRAGKSTRMSEEIRSEWGPRAAVFFRGRALGGIGYYAEAALDVGLVAEEMATAALEAARSGLGDPAVAEMPVESLAAAVRAGWVSGLTEPMLPMDANDPRRPARSRGGRRAVLPPADEMRRQAVQDTGGGDGPAQLVAFARLHWTFGNDGSTLYAVPRSGPRVAVRVGERSSFRRRLAQRMLNERGQSFRGDAYSVALEIIRADAEEAPPSPLHLRAARWRGGVVLDLGGPDARAVVVSADGWQVVETGPHHPLFRRSQHVRELPEPVHGGDLDRLAELLGLDRPRSPFETEDRWAARQRQWCLVRAWLVTLLLYPNADVPILYWSGPEGAGKTLRSSLVTSVLDPRGAVERATGGGQLGRSTEDILVAAAERFVVTYDNLTTLTSRQSDVLCGICTGTVSEGRQRYSDDEAVAITVQRAMSITGRWVPSGAGSDLLDRLVQLDCPRLPRADVVPPDLLWTEFERAHAHILGGLLDLAAQVLAVRDEVASRVRGLPRMATFGLVLECLDRLAADRGEPGGHMEAYRTAVADTKSERVDVDPLLGALVEFVGRCPDRVWEGSASELLASLPRPEDRSTAWPTNGRSLSARLKQSSTLLEAVGLSVEQVRTNQARKVTLRLDVPDDLP